ncbi:MAG: hypothetical protein ACRD1T_11330 [Acidimicrobiia bacterium]
MSAARRFAILIALVSWIYSWWILRGVRAEYATGQIGSMPLWLLILLGGATTLLLATAVTAGLRSPAWPLFAAIGGVALVAGVFGSQYGLMKSAVDVLAPTANVNVDDAVRSVFRSRGAVEITGLFGLSTLLILAGATGYLKPEKQMAEADV